VGDDITVNARTIRSIPLSLRADGAPVAPPAVLEVRGEVYMDNDDFQRVNREIEAEGEEPYANPRNLTSGTLRRLDPKIVAKRRLRFLAHGWGRWSRCRRRVLRVDAAPPPVGPAAAEGGVARRTIDEAISASTSSSASARSCRT
jgi:NAD-dependent DNA ligase